MTKAEGQKAALRTWRKLEDEMPKFILATAALFLGRQGPSEIIVAHDAMHARTRSRDATRRCGHPACTIRAPISAP